MIANCVECGAPLPGDLDQMQDDFSYHINFQVRRQLKVMRDEAMYADDMATSLLDSGIARSRQKSSLEKLQRAQRMLREAGDLIEYLWMREVKARAGEGELSLGVIPISRPIRNANRSSDTPIVKCSNAMRPWSKIGLALK